MLNRVLVAAALCTAALLPSLAVAVESVTLNIKDRVRLAIPSDWMIRDGGQRKQTSQLSQKLLGVGGQHTASFSAQSYPEPSRVSVRVSLLPMDPPMTQADLMREALQDRDGLVRDLTAYWAAEAPKLWAGLAKIGSTQVGAPRIDVQPLGGLQAMVIEYGRTSTASPTETMLVTQYHVVMGSEKALITLARIANDPAAARAHDRIKASIVFRPQ